MLSVSRESVEEAMESLHETGRIVLDTLKGISVCYLPEYYEAETYVADWMCSRAEPDLPDNLPEILREIELDSGITYAPDQKKAISTAADMLLCCLLEGRVLARLPR